mgnify:CR=1 FL=1
MTQQDRDTAVWWLRKLIDKLKDAEWEWFDGGANADTDQDIRVFSQHIGRLPGGEEVANQAWSCGAYYSTLMDYCAARDAAERLLQDLLLQE